MKETFKIANYLYQKYLGNGFHLVLNKSTNGFEIFFTNKNHASWGLIYKNTHLEFLESLSSGPK